MIDVTLHPMPHSDPKYGQYSRSASAIARDDQSTLGELLQRAAHYQHLDQILSSVLGPDLAPHCRVACQRGSELVLLTTNSSWASRIRLSSDDILCSIRSSGHREITSITVRVTPLSARPLLEPQSKVLSPAAKIALQEFADQCNDPQLSAIAQRFSSSKGRT